MANGTVQIIHTSGSTEVVIPSLSEGEGVIFLESKILEFVVREGASASDVQRYIDEIIVNMEDGDCDVTGLTIQLAHKDRKSQEWQWTAQYPISEASDIINLRLTSRYVKIKIADSAPKSIWKLSSIEIYGQKMGGRR